VLWHIARMEKVYIFLKFITIAVVTQIAFLNVARGQIAETFKPGEWQYFTDSVSVSAHASYDRVGRMHRWLFGKNYRKEWAKPVKLPVLKLSAINGGLTLVKAGGGMESKALRLKDSSGKEWVLRGVEKSPDKLLPANVQGTFVLDWVDDEFSGQHPYSALVVPLLAAAAGIPHANPVIGVVADDPALEQYRSTFSGMICLLEEREPMGNSDNTFQMEKELVRSNDVRADGKLFFRARLLDALVGDWDRHEDQWRWLPESKDNEQVYKAVPRDRDQVFHVTQGVFPSIAALPWLDPTLTNFSSEIKRIQYLLYKTQFVNAFPDFQFSYSEWMDMTSEFIKLESDSVLEAAIQRLPKDLSSQEKSAILEILKQRRDNLPAAMTSYYRFINRIVDIRLTDKPENILITTDTTKSTRITVSKYEKKNKLTDTIFTMVYKPNVTHEIRLYTQGGDDRLLIDNTGSTIPVKVIDSAGHKEINVKSDNHRLKVYGPASLHSFAGNHDDIVKHLKEDSLNRKFVPVNLYNVWVPLATVASNRDDGFLLGLGFRYTGKDGFRKSPYSMRQELLLTHSFATNAFRIRYKGEWMGVISSADLVMDAFVQAPDNTMNFFGKGNETSLNKTGDYRRFYRARFDTYQFDPTLRWHTGRVSTFSAGPSLQIYHLNADNNLDRLVSYPGLLHSSDSTTLDHDKVQLGLSASFNSDKRDNQILPAKGYYFNINAQGYEGLNADSRSYAQIRTDFTYYQKIDSAGRFVLWNRTGGGVSAGHPGFYQSMFLGGQGNLLGYLQNRFSGDHMVYNNFQGRFKLANIAGYILPGQLGLLGFYDLGRVWSKGEQSDKWHQGAGGGLYFAPASLTVIQILAGHSEEGWYPYLSLNFRL